RCSVVGICASSLQRARAVAERLDIPKAYGDWREVIADPHIDALSIALPAHLQPEIVIAAAAAGKHVFCEKPAATDLHQAQNMLVAVNQAGVVHAIDFIFPEITAWQKTSAILATNQLGKLRHVGLSWQVETYAYRAKTDSWKVRCAQGGGTLNNFASHSLYYL